MKKGIHPEYKETLAICACGEVFYTGSVKNVDALRLDVCGACHPFYTGKQKNLDTGGRIDKFKSKVAAKAAPKPVAKKEEAKVTKKVVKDETVKKESAKKPTKAAAKKVAETTPDN